MKREEVMTVRDLIRILEKVEDKDAPVVVDGDDGKESLEGCVYDACMALGEFTIHFESGRPTEEEDEEDDPSIDLAYDRWRDEQLYEKGM